MPKAITPVLSNLPADLLTRAGQAANEQAAKSIFERHLHGKAANTIRRKRGDVALFETFLNEAGVPAHGLADHPSRWTGVTWGLVEAFSHWQLRQGYAIPTISGRLSTIRIYAELAAKAGAIPPDEARMIATVKGFSHNDARHIDIERQENGIPVRIGFKKAEPTPLPEEIAEKIKHQGDTPKGRRNSLLMCIFVDHGLRVGEIGILTRKAFDLKKETMRVLRPKVGITQTIEMTKDTVEAARAYLETDAPKIGNIWRRSLKKSEGLGKQLRDKNITRSLSLWINEMGRKEGIEFLTGHDCRHFWATYEANHGTQYDRLKDGGGWKSPYIPMRYIAAAAIANEGTARIKEKHKEKE